MNAIRYNEIKYQEIRDVLQKKLGMALTIQDLSFGDVKNIEDLIAMDFMPTSMLRAWGLLSAQAIGKQKEAVIELNDSTGSTGEWPGPHNA